MKKIILAFFVIASFFINNNFIYAASADDFDENDLDYYDDYIEDFTPPHLQDELYYFQRQMRDAEKISVLAYEKLLLFIKMNDSKEELDHIAVRFYGKQLLQAQQYTREKIRQINYTPQLVDVYYSALKYAEQKVRFIKKMLSTLDGTANGVDMSKEKELLDKASKQYKEELYKISGKPGQIFKPTRDLEIAESHVITDLYGNTYIEGVLKNNTLKSFNTVQITFHAYDENSRLLGVSETFTSPIQSKDTYIFRAPLTVYNYHYLKLMKFRATEITSNGNVTTSFI